MKTYSVKKTMEQQRIKCKGKASGEYICSMYGIIGLFLSKGGAFSRLGLEVVGSLQGKSMVGLLR